MDRRQQKTRLAIFNAFTALLSRKSYTQISVQEIIDEADIGRTTFYSHFETKDYLLKELCEELFEHISESTLGHSSTHRHIFECSAPDSVFLHLIKHLEKNDNHILDLLSSENNDIFGRYFKSNLKKLIQSIYSEQSNRPETNPPEDYLINYIASAFVETVNWWIQGGKRESPTVITDYFLRTTEPILKKL